MIICDCCIFFFSNRDAGILLRLFSTKITQVIFYLSHNENVFEHPIARYSGGAKSSAKNTKNKTRQFICNPVTLAGSFASGLPPHKRTQAMPWLAMLETPLLLLQPWTKKDLMWH
jgi:hypothetical protein